MRQLSSRLLATALAGAAGLVLPALPTIARAQALDTVKAAAVKVLPAATQVVQQKVGGGSGGAAPSGTAGQVVNAVKQVASPQPQPQQGNPTLTQKAVGAVKQVVSRRKSQPAPAQPSAPSNRPVNMPPNMPAPAASSGGGGGGGGAPPP